MAALAFAFLDADSIARHSASSIFTQPNRNPEYSLPRKSQDDPQLSLSYLSEAEYRVLDVDDDPRWLEPLPWSTLLDRTTNEISKNASHPVFAQIEYLSLALVGVSGNLRGTRLAGLAIACRRTVELAAVALVARGRRDRDRVDLDVRSPRPDASNCVTEWVSRSDGNRTRPVDELDAFLIAD